MFTTSRRRFLSLWFLIIPANFCQAATYNCTAVSVPGASTARLYAVNNSGTAAGTYQLNNVNHGFTYSVASGTIATIDYPGSNSTQLTSAVFVEGSNTTVWTIEQSSAGSWQ